MADNINFINLDLDKKYNLINDTIVIRQGETGVRIVANIFSHGKQVTGLSKATFSCVKPDGHVVIDDSASISGSTISYNLSQQVGAAAGEIETAYFTINGMLSTGNINIRVLSDADSSLGSSDYVNGIDALENDLAKKLKDLTDEYNKKYSDILNQIKNIDVSDEITKALADLTAKYDAKIQELLNMINNIDISDELHKAIQEQLDAVKAEFNAAVKNANDNANSKLDQLIKLITTVQEKIDLSNQKIKEADTALSNLATEVTKIDGFLDQQHKLIWDDYLNYRTTLQADFDNFKSAITTSVSSLKSDITELQKRADEITEELKSVDLTLMQKNANAIDKLKIEVASASEEFTNLSKTVDENEAKSIIGATMDDVDIPIEDNILKIISKSNIIDKSKDQTFDIDNLDIDSGLYTIDPGVNKGTFPEKYPAGFLVHLKQNADYAIQFLFHINEWGNFEIRNISRYSPTKGWYDRRLSRKITYGEIRFESRDGISQFIYNYQSQVGILGGLVTIGKEPKFYKFTEDMNPNILQRMSGTPIMAVQNFKNGNYNSDFPLMFPLIMDKDGITIPSLEQVTNTNTTPSNGALYSFEKVFFTTDMESNI